MLPLYLASAAHAAATVNADLAAKISVASDVNAHTANADKAVAAENCS